MSRDGHFDAEIARDYDRLHGPAKPSDLDPMINLLVTLAGDGAALEFAIGTGRVALPLAARGVQVSGIEMSQPMVDRLREKPGGDAIDVKIGDMVAARKGSGYALVYLVYNTIDNLVTQSGQLACFTNAARHLAPGGRFLVETLVPPLRDLPRGQTERAFSHGHGHWGIDRFDLVTQRYTSTHFREDPQGIRRTTIPFRYAWPSELDLMALMAGLELEQRWAGWDRSPFTEDSRQHVSVWRKRQA
ncbi:methyltransferase domain-containing protein [Oceanomicrobium pacificus]|uniref:Methyltransferase domain-containing protein n=1 Tax=Oceanomicrobium pacificus TaxID=2692916 RepID=A0A6B0TLB7_9RHOB|nr:class I SAM-dependent methyltransferase [Oceanomicrobium pacificus]MXU65297.1 methyltransferase domain-containing protein [Oceanomicrobium pacificus]